MSQLNLLFFSNYYLQSCKFFDITGETTFFPLIIYSHYTYANRSPSQNLVTALSLIWCARLGIFLGWRIFERGSDWRFDKLMKAPAYNCFDWVAQVRAGAKRQQSTNQPPFPCSFTRTTGNMDLPSGHGNLEEPYWQR